MTSHPDQPNVGSSATSDESEKQCRICLDGEDPESGRLIRPCLCKGSISYVHIKCLQRWRLSSASRTAFYSCQQCGYHYHFARTRVYGIATNPVVVAALSAVFFTILVLCSSFVTSWILEGEDDSWFALAPWAVFRNLVRSTVHSFTGIDLDLKLRDYSRKHKPAMPFKSPTRFRWFVRRFLLGLPVVGAGSIVQILLSLPMPFHWLRGRTRRLNRDSRDAATLILITMVIIGAARALWKVYRLTEKLVSRTLLRAEDAILEVS